MKSNPGPRYKSFRSVAQINFAPLETDATDLELAMVRRILRTIQTRIPRLPPGIKLDSPACVRYLDHKIIFLVKNAALYEKLRHFLPAIDKALQANGIFAPSSIRVVPVQDHVTLRAHKITGKPREITPEAAQSVKAVAMNMEQGALRNALLGIAACAQKTQNPNDKS